MNKLKYLVILIPAVFLLSCASTVQKKSYSEDLMSAPDVFSTELDPFNRSLDWQQEIPRGILYVTARKPAPEGSEVPYLNERDSFLHLGVARIGVKGSEVSRGELLDISNLETTDKKYPLTVEEVNDLGPLENTVHVLAEIKKTESAQKASEQFAGIINGLLEKNPVKDIYIFVHGVNTSFEEPLYVADEYWHYMGYRGVFIAFSWPSGQDILKYISDVDSAEYSAVMFREFLQYLTDNTIAERIHILAWSAGTKLTSQAVHQYSLMQNCTVQNEHKPKLGQLIYVAGDVERQLLSMYIADGLLDPFEGLTSYMSETDQALKASDTIHKYPRIGQPWKLDEQTPEMIDFIENNRNKLTFVDVTGAPGANQGNGHEYFRSSPWVSSDIIAVLLMDMTPEERGLVHKDGLVYWSFPDDYIERLRDGINKKKNTE